MKKLMAIFLVFLTSCALGSTQIPDNRQKVFVIDTGVSYSQSRQEYMCVGGVVDVTGRGAYDRNGHGTNVIGLISPSINPKTHCIVSVKFYYKEMYSSEALRLYKKALELVVSNTNVSLVNSSLAGKGSDLGEFLLVKKILNRGIAMVVAAGNRGENLDLNCDTYPACYRNQIPYKNFFVVGAKNLLKSNTGSVVTHIEYGTNIGTPALTGTSQATAVRTSKILKSMVYKNKGENNRSKNGVRVNIRKN